MKNLSYLTIILFFQIAISQTYGQANNFSAPVLTTPASPLSTGTSGTGANYDVKYQKILWRISPDSSLYLKGVVQTNFLTTVNNVTSISFDLNSIFTVTAVTFRGVTIPGGSISRGGNILTISLGVTLPINKYDSIYVSYQGIPPLPPTGSGPQGFKKLVSSGLNYMMSVAESYEDRDWWPCKADMQDKIDTLEIKVNVPWASPTSADTFWAVANGRLVDSTILGNSRTFTYRTNYPIASYLVGVSVGRFNRYYRGTVNINGTPVPVVYSLLAGKPAATYTTYLTALDKMNLVIAAYSQKFGDYPFKNDKHGYYDGLVGAGGIEHQGGACIATGQLTNLQTLAHELMHQWFGDNVSFNTWNDLWLAEGFANYSEALVGELVPSLGINPFTVRSGIKSAALGLSAQSAWIPNGNMTTSALIWGSNYGTTVYKRGAMVASMLRTMCGDTKYFQALTNYQTNRAGKSANADTLKNYFNAILGGGVDLKPFFDDYVGGSGSAAAAVGGVGNPDYSILWNNPTANQLDISVGSQTQSSGSNVVYFNGPVVLHVKGSTVAQDTTIVFVDWGSGNLSKAGNGIGIPKPNNYLRYYLSFKPLTVVFDDSARTLSTGVTIKTGVLATTVTNFTARKISAGNQINLTIVKDEPVTRILLLKSSDGRNFSEIGEMVLTTNDPHESKYIFLDGSASSATVFYKAKVVTVSKEEYTTVVKITLVSSGDVSITPNPADHFAEISFINTNNEQTTCMVISPDGRWIMQESTYDNNIKLNVSTLPVGIYAVRIIKNNTILQTKKLLIQR